MKTESIQNILKLKFGEKEYTKEELESIQSLTIQRFDIAGNIVEVDASDLCSFPNLESLTIQQCSLDNNFIHYICGLKKLHSLSLLSCEFLDNYEEFLQLPLLKDLCLDGTEISLSLLNGKIFDTLILSNIELSEKVEFIVNRLVIAKCTVTDWSFLNSKIDTLVVSSKQYDTTPLLQEYKGYMIVMEENHQFVREEVNG